MRGASTLPPDGLCVDMPFSACLASGEDARAFLNGQFSSDVNTLSVGRWQLSSYSTPKGRALATFVVAAPASGGHGDAFWLVTRRSVAEPTLKRLAMFVMRSKVRWAHNTHAVVGVSGAAARQGLVQLFGAEPPSGGDCVSSAAGSPAAALAADSGQAPQLIGLGAEAWWLLVPVEARDALVDALHARLPRMSAADWDAIEVAAGRPWVETETREAFVPQMLNLDLTGGISFKKGCYPGQEIVARTQYLGKVKRRMLRFAVPWEMDAAPPPPGLPVYAAGDADQAIGQVVLAASLNADRAQLLAVLQLDLATGADLRLGAADGVALRALELPYPFD
jgi:folate-binding protein YgfZ